MNRLALVAVLCLLLCGLGCDQMENIEIPDLTGGDGDGEVAQADSSSTTDSTSNGGEEEESTDGEAANDSQEPADDSAETSSDGEEPSSGDGSDPPADEFSTLGKLEAEAAAALVAAGAQVKVENEHVTEFSWEYAELNDELAGKLLQLTHLKYIDLEQGQISDAFFAGIGNFKQLQYINLDDTATTDAILGQVVLKGTPTIIDCDATQLTRNSLDGLIKSGKHITIHMRGMTDFPDSILAEAAKVSKNRLGFIGNEANFGKVVERPAKVAGVDQIE